MRKKLTIVFILLLSLIIIVTIQNNKSNNIINNKQKEAYKINLSDNFFNDLDKEVKNINLSKNKNYIKKTGEFKVQEFSIPCSIKNEQDENENIQTYLRLPAWFIRYTDVENQKILLSQTRQDSNNINLILKNITIYDNKFEIQEYELQEGTINQNARIDFLLLYLEENNKE